MNSDKKFEQNQELIRNLETMRSQERIESDPIFKNNLRQQLVGNFQNHQKAAPVVHDLPSESDQYSAKEFVKDTKQKFRFAFKLVPALLLLFVVVFSAKNFLSNTPPTNSDKAEDFDSIAMVENPAPQVESSSPPRLEAEKIQPLSTPEDATGPANESPASPPPTEAPTEATTENTIDTQPLAAALPAQKRVDELADDGDLELDAPVMPIQFHNIAPTEKNSINHQIINEFIISDLSIYSISADKTTPKTLQLTIELTSGSTNIYTYEREGKGWKTISFEKSN